MLRRLACPSPSSPSLSQLLQSHNSTTPARYFASSAKRSPRLGIRREDKNRWERRVPLTPKHVRSLVQEGIEVVVQPSNTRVFSNGEFEQVGAKLEEDLSSCETILAVKEVPMEKLIPDKTYLFFSHTIKAQPYNMPLLDDILRKNIRLIDYERIRDVKTGERLVRFGNFAGYAGFIDALRATGDCLLGRGFATPFLNSGFSTMYLDLPGALRSVSEVGQVISKLGLPEALCPFVYVFTGTGSVSSGAQNVFKHLPHKWVKAEDLPALFANKDDPAHRTQVYGVLASSADLVEHKDPSKRGQFDKAHYYANPSDYQSKFARTLAPYTSVLVNGIYWDKNYPRVLTREEAHHLAQTGKLRRLVCVCDISCDIEGSIEFLDNVTTIDEPTIMYDPLTEKHHKSPSGPGFVIVGVDNLPSELPREASTYFGDCLLPFVSPLVKTPFSLSFAEAGNVMPKELHNAVITDHGALTPQYKYIAELRKAYERGRGPKKVLVIGAGFCSGPLVDLLTKNPSNHVTIASDVQTLATQMAAGRPNVQPLQLNVNDPAALKLATASHDVVVSMVPAPLHPLVAEACLATKKNMVTASYTSPALRAFHDRFAAAGLVMLNEVGLDPGIDHLSALKVINDVHTSGGSILSFVSWCGGLVAPEHADNPFGYKFSWSPRGVLTAGRNSARFLYHGQTVEVPGETLFKGAAEVDIGFPALAVEGYANRDCLDYIKLYNIPETKTMFRGTLRYKGYSLLMHNIGLLGLFSLDSAPLFASGSSVTWRDYVCRHLGLAASTTQEALEAALLNRLGLQGGDASKVLHAFRWVGLLSDTPIEPKGTALDSLCALLQSKLALKPGDRDLVLLHHRFGIQHKNGKKETLTSSLIATGEPSGHSAMGRTVGYTAAIAAQMVLDGRVVKTGVLEPMMPELFNPMLAALENSGICMVEQTQAFEDIIPVVRSR